MALVFRTTIYVQESREVTASVCMLHWNSDSFIGFYHKIFYNLNLRLVCV